MGHKIYLLGLRDSSLSSDEQTKLDEHNNKWSSGWAVDPYKPIDQRSPDFKNVYETFKDDGKTIAIFQEFSIDEGKDKPRLLEAFGELKSLFPDITFEAHDDNGKIA